MKKKKTNSVFKRRIVSSVLLLLSTAALFILPSTFRRGLTADPFEDYFLPRSEPAVGIISVWHIVSFKPYVGSLGTWIDQRTKDFASSYNNLYFEVKSLSPEDAAVEFNRGNYPDIISFAQGTVDRGDLLSVENGSSCAYPFCASGLALVYDPVKTESLSESDIIGSAGSVQDFKTGKVFSCITDIRGAGDLLRAQLIGKCPYFEIKPVGPRDDLVQYVGIYNRIKPEKIPYAVGFIDYLISENAQSKLESIGLFPVLGSVAAEYGDEWLNDLYLVFKNTGTPPPL